MPLCERRTPLVWSISMQRAGKEVFHDRHELAVFPRPAMREGSLAVALFDPLGSTRKCLEAAGLRPMMVQDLAGDLGACDLLVIGDGALRADVERAPVVGSVSPQRRALLDFVNRGGRLLVLRQDAYPDGLLDASLSGHRSTMTFPMALRHPALREVAAEDLKFWAGDHLVTDREPARPARGGFTPIIVSGSAAGVDHAPLLEQSLGAGRIVYSQLRLIEKSDVEPAAARVLWNLIDYLGTPRAVPKKTAVVGASPACNAFLNGLGLQFETLSGDLDAAQLRPFGLVVCCGELPRTDPLLDWVRAGGNLVVHRVNAEHASALCRQMQLNLIATEMLGPVVRVDGEHPLLDAIAREDLYWLGRHEGIDWAETPRAARMADLALAKTLDGAKPAVHSVTDWKLEGSIVQQMESHVVFATVGTAAGEIDFPLTGDYIVGIVARGTPCDGVFPRARIAVDDQSLGEVSTSAEWSTLTVAGRVEAGRHKVSVSFLNDGSGDGEDRNMYLEKMLVARDERAGEVCFLTSPAAVAAIPRGKGTVVFDMLPWDTEENNGRKAARYAAALLTALGGQFPPRLGTLFECEQMTPQSGMPFFSNKGSHAAMACNGFIETPIEVAVAGSYGMELVASGSPAAGVYPLVEVVLDDRTIGRVQLTSGGWRSYFVEVALPAGKHNLRLVFVNDLNVGGEDRNVMLDKVTFYGEQPAD